MFKRWFELSSPGGTPDSGSAPHQGMGLMAMADECQRSAATPAAAEIAPASDFDQIYQSAAVKPPDLSYGILKIVGMMGSPHLKGMTPEAKRCALLMALEAAGAEVEDLLQDAVVRQRALNDYGDRQQDKLARFETVKAEENRTIQAELDRITGQYMTRIQVNMDEVARQQDALFAWQRKKQDESQKIADAAAYLVSEGNPSHASGLTAVLERASQSRRPA